MVARFHDLSEAYLQRYLELSASTGPVELWSVIHQYALYADEYALARSVKIADLLRATLDVPGNVVEFGSWHGANLLYLAKMLRIFDPHSAKRVHAFDSFEGLETFTPEDGAASRFRSLYKGSHEKLLEAIRYFSMEQEIVIHQGEISQTLPRVLQEHPGLRFSFVYCDVDLYEPTAAILSQVHGRLAVGGLFVMDEYGWDEFPGETLAVEEFLDRHGREYEKLHLRDVRQPTLALRKLA